MQEPSATKPLSPHMPKIVPTTSARTPRVASDVISRTDVSSEPREDTRSPSEDQIRSRAYEIYIESGYEDGRATEHWLAAERELLDESTLQTIGSPSVKSSQ
jgi:hypothetical protein